jgi:hypothetical protein
MGQRLDEFRAAVFCARPQRMHRLTLLRSAFRAPMGQGYAARVAMIRYTDAAFCEHPCQQFCPHQAFQGEVVLGVRPSAGMANDKDDHLIPCRFPARRRGGDAVHLGL